VSSSVLRALIVVPSIRELTNLVLFKDQLINQSCEAQIVIIDEGDGALRAVNNKLLHGLNYSYFGPREREDWFKARFKSAWKKLFSVIPERCHAETSFGFLLAYAEEPDIVIELDDDVSPINEHPLINLHARNLYERHGQTIKSDSRWYNTIENLKLNTGQTLFPRGHPYSKECRQTNYLLENRGSECVLNMGLWGGNLDLDALTILYHQGLHGTCEIEGTGVRRRKLIVARGTYFAVCSMDTSFKPKIIPAFYQLYMKHMGIDRFDDIWSGIFVKKVADHLGDNMCLGEPLVIHRKTPRNTLEDLRAELEGIIINETLWKIVDALELQGESYFDAYRSLIEHLRRNLQQFPRFIHKKFMEFQLNKMELWLEVIDQLK